MAWTLALLLCIAAYFIVVLFNNTFHIFQRKAFVYPSEAEIDQILPPEVIEAIMAHMDLKTLFSCSMVSKYWRHHAEKDNIQKLVIKTWKKARVCVEELFDDLNKCNQAHKIQNRYLEWLSYDRTYYKPQWFVRDQQYIDKLGKKLLDVDIGSIQKISKVFNTAYNDNNTNPKHKYIVRSRGIYAYDDQTEYSFYRKSGSFQTINFDSADLPMDLKAKLTSGVQIEFIEEMSNIDGRHVTLSKPANIRIIETRKSIGGVPIDGSIFLLVCLLFIPCVVKDIATMMSPNAKNFMNLIIGAITAVMVLLISSLGVFYYVRLKLNVGYETMEPKFNGPFVKYSGKNCYNSSAYIMILLCLFSLTKFPFCYFYGLSIKELIKTKHPKCNQVLFISFCFVVSIVDWKTTADAVRSGDFWFTLLYNFGQYVLIALWAWVITIAGNLIALLRWSWSALRPDPNNNRVLLSGLLMVLYVTCAAPYSTQKIVL